MSGSNVIRAFSRCWLCTQVQPRRGGQRVTARGHWVCADCWNRKVYQLADWFLDALMPAQRHVVLVALRRTPPINAPAPHA